LNERGWVITFRSSRARSAQEGACMKQIQNWDCTRPGINSFDELHRALMDIRRLTEIFKRIADVSFIEKYELPEDRAEKLENKRIDARKNWEDWEPALERAFNALDIDDLDEYGISKTDMVKAIGALNSVFPPPIFIVPGRQLPGDHLSALTHQPDGTSNFPITKVIAAFEAIDEAVDVLRLVAPTLDDSQMGWNRMSSHNELRPARWFTKVTNGVLTGDVLRKAVNRSSLSQSIKSESGSEWMHSPVEVSRKYTQHKPKIMAAYSKEQI
jgi:hypothetical protein